MANTFLTRLHCRLLHAHLRQAMHVEVTTPVCNGVSQMRMISAMYTNNNYWLSDGKPQRCPIQLMVLPLRQYAKGKSRPKKEKKGEKHKDVEKTLAQLEEQMTANDEVADVVDFAQLKADMETALDHLKNDFVQQVSLRTSAATFHNLIVKLETEKVPLGHLAQISQKSPQNIHINMASAPEAIPDVINALASSSMKLNPQSDGLSVHLTIPKVTREHREELAKTAKSLCNKSKDNLRSILNRYDRMVRKQEAHHPKDVLIDINHKVQLMYKSYVEKAETITKQKQDELLNTS